MIGLLNEKQSSLDFFLDPQEFWEVGKRRNLEIKKATKVARVLLCDDLCFKDEGQEPH